MHISICAYLHVCVCAYVCTHYISVYILDMISYCLSMINNKSITYYSNLFYYQLLIDYNKIIIKIYYR